MKQIRIKKPTRLDELAFIILLPHFINEIEHMSSLYSDSSSMAIHGSGL